MAKIPQLKTAIFAAYSYQIIPEKWKLNLGVRKEWIDSLIVPFTWSIGSAFQFNKHVTILANANKTYRIPTLNDRYWSPGGNPTLKPEYGFSQELGLKFSHQKTVSIESEWTVFNRNMNDWIIWLPISSTVWSPKNIAKVWSRGVEQNMRVEWTKGAWTFNVANNMNWIFSTNQSATSASDLSVGKQLIYVPIFSGMVKLGAKYRQLSFAYRYNYMSKRFTTSDNATELPDYSLSSFYVDYQMNFKKVNTYLFCKINNLFNQNYQVIQWRPMPLRNYELGVNFKLN